MIGTHLARGFNYGVYVMVASYRTSKERQGERQKGANMAREFKSMAEKRRFEALQADKEPRIEHNDPERKDEYWNVFDGKNRHIASVFSESLAKVILTELKKEQ